MKMQQETFDTLKSAIDALLSRHPTARSEYALKGLSNERFRWDLYHAAKGHSITREDPGNLTDAHIDTALRAIVTI